MPLLRHIIAFAPINEPTTDEFPANPPYRGPAQDSEKQRAFAPVAGVVAGRRNSTSYFRERDGVAVYDTQGENFLVSSHRMVPIDALIVYADAELAAFLSMPADERLAEIGFGASRIP